MRIPKRYGQSKSYTCLYCDRQATHNNANGLPMCTTHRNERSPDFKCACGEWLDVRSGKWGPYFFCMNCGNITFARGLNMNEHIIDECKKKADVTKTVQATPEKSNTVQRKTSTTPRTPKETTVTSDELDFM